MKIDVDDGGISFVFVRKREQGLEGREERVLSGLHA